MANNILLGTFMDIIYVYGFLSVINAYWDQSVGSIKLI